MKRIVLSSLLAVMVWSSASFALPSGTIKFMNYTSPHGLGGGEFTLKNVGSSALGAVGVGETWRTFCIEYPEHVSIGATYNAYVNTGAVRGGNAGQTAPAYDPLDARTAYLYTKFWHGTLSNYNHDTYSATNLQVAIWKLENELDDGAGTTFTKINYNNYDQAKAWVAEATQAVNSGNWSGLGNVRAVNLFDRYGRHKQDQLILVPAPGSFLLATLGISAVGYLRRRRAAVEEVIA